MDKVYRPLGVSERRCVYPTSYQGRCMELLPQQVHPERSTFPASMSSTHSSICQVRGLAAVWWTLPAQPPLPEIYLYACLGGSSSLDVSITQRVSQLVQSGVTNGVLLSECQPPQMEAPSRGRGSSSRAGGAPGADPEGDSQLRVTSFSR